MDHMVEISGLNKDFGPVRILHDINLNVVQGEVLALIGASGSGKSTCLRCINRLEEPTSGRIVIDGLDTTAPGININHVRRQIGMVFQSINLYPNMTALGNVTLALRKVQRLSGTEANAIGRHHLEQVGLGDRMQYYPNQLSGGQQQRVGIARALALSPKVLLLDEPTSALDPELVGEVLQVLGKVRESGMTMMIVTHEMQFAREAADQVVFMEAGRILEQGSPEELLENPRHKRIQDFMSRVSMR